MIPPTSKITIKHCSKCASTNIEIRDQRSIAITHDQRKILACNDCGASVGCHPGTEIPLGIMADKTTRRLRTKAHEEFDRMWNTGLMTRAKAYTWLAHELGIRPDDCHMSWMSNEQLRDVATLSATYLRDNEKALIRRKEKRTIKFHIAKKKAKGKRNERRRSED